MKIIKTPKFKPQTCIHCGTVVQLKKKDLTTSPASCIKDYWRCPICNYGNIYEWEKNEV